MTKYSNQELKTTLLNTLAVQGIKVHELDLTKKWDLQTKVLRGFKIKG